MSEFGHRPTANKYLDLSPDQVIGLPVNNVLAADLVHDIRSRLQTVAGTGIVERMCGQRLKLNGRPFDVAVLVSGKRLSSSSWRLTNCLLR